MYNKFIYALPLNPIEVCANAHIDYYDLYPDVQLTLDNLCESVKVANEAYELSLEQNYKVHINYWEREISMLLENINDLLFENQGYI